MAKKLAPTQETLQTAFALFQRREFAKAETLARRVMAANPRHAPLIQFVGILCHSQKKHVEAADLFARALRIDPTSGEGHYNLGSALVSLERFAEALPSLERSLALRPGNYDTLNNLGIALNGLQRHGEAESVLRRAITTETMRPEAHVSLGLALAGQRRFEEAAGCLEAALAKGHPDPAAVYLNLGRVYQAWERSRAAIECFKRSLEQHPRQLQVLIALAEAELHIGAFAAAARTFAAAQEVMPRDVRVLTGLIYARRNAADWREEVKLDRDLQAVLKSGVDADEPFRLLSIRDDPALHLRSARRYAARYRAPALAAAHAPRAEDPGRKLRVAYLSGDFGHHAVGLLTAGLFEHHDRGAFETFAYAWGTDQSALRRRLEAAFDHFIDVNALADAEVAARMRAAGIDIAVDLQGFTGRLRSPILADRPAPIQVSYLGYPATMGADWIDYIIADRFVIPPAEEKHYSERVVCLPHCYQANDSKRPLPAARPARATVGLPEQGFVFACFNNTYKVVPAVFAVWMRLLAAAPGSMLWLYCKEEDAAEPRIADTLRREAARAGIAAERLVFAPFAPFEEHVRRLQCADLFLDTWPYNGGSTASDALWAGLPIVTLAGRSFVARMAGSLLNAVGLPELVAASLEEYEAIAQRMAADPAALAGVRTRLASARTRSPLFDTAQFTANLEAAYREMWRRHAAGQPPASIDLSPGR